MHLICTILPACGCENGWKWSLQVCHELVTVYSLQHWSKLEKSEGAPWPEERCDHAACCLNYGQQHPQLLVTGGVNRALRILEDAWILDVDCKKWRKVRKVYCTLCDIYIAQSCGSALADN